MLLGILVLGNIPGLESYRLAQELARRVRCIYEAIFVAAQRAGVRNPVMLPMGLGVFLENVHADDRAAVRGGRRFEATAGGAGRAVSR